VAGIAATGLPRLELRTDGRALVPRADPAVRFDAELRRDFGLRDPLLVYLETAQEGGIYDLATLSKLRDLTEAIAALPEIDPQQVMSLATEARPRVYTGTLDFRPLFDPMPDTAARMQDLRDDVDAIDILTGTLVSGDRRGASVLVGVPPSVSEVPHGVDRADLYRRIVSLVESHQAAGQRIEVVGAPAAEALLGWELLDDLRMLVPLAIAGIGLVLLVACRRLAAVAIALVEVGACLAFTFGVMGFSGVPVYLTSAVLPVILATIGIADEVHILWNYQRQLGAGDADAGGALWRTMEEMVRPITITSVTTAIGFLSFVVAPIGAVRSFGLFAALGIGFCWIWSLTAVPASLALLGGARLARPSAAGSSRAGSLAFAGLERALARPRTTLVALAGVTMILGAGAFALQVQDSWIDGFAPRSPFRRATEHVDRVLAGTHVLLAELRFEADPARRPKAWYHAGPFIDPAVIRAVGAFEAGLRELPGVGGVLGPYSHLASVHHLFMAQQPGTRRIPDDPDRVSLIIGRFDQVRGVKRRREVIHDDMHRAVVTLYLRHANYRQTARIMAGARALETRHLAPLGARIEFGGDIAVSQAMIPAIVHTQLGSLALALLGAFLCVSAIARSPRIGTIALLPTVAAVVWLLGAMGWLRIPVGVATSTFCAITLGIGVDYAVHFLERVRRVASPLRAAREVAPAIVADAVAVSAGFGILAVSQVPANARLGVIIALALLSSAALTLLGLGALLVLKRGAGIDPAGLFGSDSLSRP
jgi:predicted RND superfamily exporter protein